MKAQQLYWSPKEIMCVTGLSKSAVYALMHRADFPAVRVGDKRFLVSISDFESWMRNQRDQQKVDYAQTSQSTSTSQGA